MRNDAPARCRRSPLLSAGDVILSIELWRTGLYDTLDIARHLFVAEHAVARALQAVRDLRHEQGGTACKLIG